MTPYESLSLLPALIAEKVCATPYTGQEWSNPGFQMVRRTEAARRQMTPEQIQEFTYLCDERCRMAYENKIQWMMECAQAKGNSGRDQLYIWIAHWLASYLQSPKRQ